MTELNGKSAIVTGGGSGIGASVALDLGRQGVKVVVCGRRMEPLNDVVTQIVAAGGQAISVQADVALEEDVSKVVETAVAAYGPIDILINNAGISGGGPIHQHTIATWDRVIAINLRGPFLFCNAVLPMMRERQQGHIINISSESGLEHYPGNGAYGVSKHALNALSEYIQRENQDLGIRVDAVCPGMVITEMTQNAPGLNFDKSLVPEDIAALVTWLLSRRANIKIGRPVLIQTMANPWQ